MSIYSQINKPVLRPPVERGLRALLRHMQSSASRSGGCQRGNGDSCGDHHGEPQDQSLHLLSSFAGRTGRWPTSKERATPPESAASARLRRGGSEEEELARADSR